MLRDVKHNVSDGLLGFATPTGDGLHIKVGVSPVVSDTPIIVTGDMDHTVHPSHTLRMVDALIKEGKNFDMLVLPGNSHGFSGEAEEFFERKLWFHFAKHLLGDASADYQGDLNYFLER